ncbi:FtsX-like permease family protein, partial [Georgenia sp. SYP-B2076]|uniref:FtsX-like permease family protein n=1 Tax=Georgenia sp. SYP-B2076 TaxID=2495881 RepID=UPI0013E0667A
MLRLTLAQMRRSAGRLTAAGLAIVVGTAFVAATLLAGALIRDTTYAAVTATLADADVVVHRTDEAPLTTEDVAAIAALDSVGAADGVASLYGQVRAGGRQDAAVLTPAASTPGLDPFTLVAGRTPAIGEVALTEAAAARLDVGIGAPVRVEVDRFDEGSGTWVTGSTDLTLSGVLADPPAISGSASAVVVARTTLEDWLRARDHAGPTSYDSVLVAAAPGAAPAAVAQEVASVMPGGVVRTALEEAELKTLELTGDSDTLTNLVLGFAAVAMVVAGLVIANTFQVLVAQRTRFLALLRCVGATKAQVHGSVLLEALVLGVLAGVVGVVAGLALGQGALWFLGRADLGLDLAPTITLTPAVVVVPVLTGAGVTVLAALAPARAATRVRPLAALRPVDAPAARRAWGRFKPDRARGNI